jgi:phospholipid-binding lipoprotein MlaA
MRGFLNVFKRVKVKCLEMASSSRAIMRTKPIAIQDNVVFEAPPDSRDRVRGKFTRVTNFWPFRRPLPVVHWMRAVLIGLAVAGPAYAEDAFTSPGQEPIDPIEQGKIDAANDPAESINRGIFGFNKFFDDNVLKPAARAFGEDVSPELRQGIHNLATNVQEPLVFANDLLQANVGRAWNTAQRFAINSTFGVAGIVDVAGRWDRPYHYADLGQTFGVWGIPAGPAVQIPVLGPSNLRDATGLAATSLASFFAPQTTIVNAVSYTELGATAVTQVDYRAKILPNTDALEKNSKDLYAATRLIKAQMRAKYVEEGKAGAVSRSGASGSEGSRP